MRDHPPIATACRRGQSGFHHVCRSFGDYDATVERLERSGVAIATAGVLGETRFCYADTRATIGCMLEVVDQSDGGIALNKLIRDGSLDWDGSDPVRPVDFVKLLGLGTRGQLRRAVRG